MPKQHHTLTHTHTFADMQVASQYTDAVWPSDFLFLCLTLRLCGDALFVCAFDFTVGLFRVLQKQYVCPSHTMWNQGLPESAGKGEWQREDSKSIKSTFSLAVTGGVKANRRERVSKKNGYYRHYRESRSQGSLTTNNPVKLKLCDQE